MAERVQADLELMLTELEQMQRVNLLSPEEVKVLIKRRKRYEYKLQKQTKIKEDILAYIQYEGCLLDLIELRRDKIGYLHKKNEIDGAIAQRIHKLFKIVEHRYHNPQIVRIRVLWSSFQIPNSFRDHCCSLRGL